MAALTLQGMLGASDAVTQSFLTQTYPAIANAISGPVYYVAIIYWGVAGYKIVAGHEPLRWNDILARLFLTAGIFASLNWGGMAQVIYKVFFSFMDSAAATIMAGESTPTMLDALWNNVGKVSALMLKSDFYEMGLIVQGYGLLLINCLLFVVALAYMTVAKFGLAINMVLLPLFLPFFFFQQTRQWAMNWISQMLNFCFIYILVIAIVRFGFLAFGEAITEAGKASSVLEAAKINVTQVAYLFIIEGVLIFFMFYVKSWAAQLSGGAAVHGASAVMRLFGGRR